eukprot:m.202290 g.202290  ORF g.202290 m.202290 type:complete len:856 (-) comp16872_c9_seq5:56-2623(-)
MDDIVDTSAFVSWLKSYTDRMGAEEDVAEYIKTVFEQNRDVRDAQARCLKGLPDLTNDAERIVADVFAAVRKRSYLPESKRSQQTPSQQRRPAEQGVVRADTERPPVQRELPTDQRQQRSGEQDQVRDRNKEKEAHLDRRRSGVGEERPSSPSSRGSSRLQPRESASSHGRYREQQRRERRDSYGDEEDARERRWPNGGRDRETSRREEEAAPSSQPLPRRHRDSSDRQAAEGAGEDETYPRRRRQHSEPVSSDEEEGDRYDPRKRARMEGRSYEAGEEVAQRDRRGGRSQPTVPPTQPSSMGSGGATWGFQVGDQMPMQRKGGRQDGKFQRQQQLSPGAEEYNPEQPQMHGWPGGMPHGGPRMPLMPPSTFAPQGMGMLPPSMMFGDMQGFGMPGFQGTMPAMSGTPAFGSQGGFQPPGMSFSSTPGGLTTNQQFQGMPFHAQVPFVPSGPQGQMQFGMQPHMQMPSQPQLQQQQQQQQQDGSAVVDDDEEDLSEPPLKVEGIYVTDTPVILFQMIERQIEVAFQKGGGAVFAAHVLEECYLCLHRFHKEYDEALSTTLTSYTGPNAKPQPRYLVEHMMAVVNNCHRSRSYLKEVLTKMEAHYPRHAPEYMRAEAQIHDELEPGFSKLAVKGVNILVELMFVDIENIYEDLFTIKWMRSRKAMKRIVATLEDYCSDFKSHLNPTHFYLLICNVLKRTVILYIRALVTKRYRPKDEQDRDIFIKGLEEETEMIRNFFEGYETVTDSTGKDPTRALTYLRQMLEASPSMIKMAFLKMRSEFPGFTYHHLESVILIREDFKQKDARTFIRDTVIGKKKSKSDPPDPTEEEIQQSSFFVHIPVSTSTNFTLKDKDVKD